VAISFKKLGSGKTGGEYYLNAAKVDDYYLNDGVSGDPAQWKEPPGTWYDPSGALSQWIADGDPVDAHRFRSFLGGFDPITDEPLVIGAGDDHVSGYDFTFSAPKGVSALWAQVSPEHRDEIEKCHRDATRGALQKIVEHVQLGRMGKAGAEKVRVDLVGAIWPHGSSRENDPQLHEHYTIFNLARYPDGKFRAISEFQMLQWQAALAGYYHTELAHQLGQRLGIRVAVRDGEYVFDCPDVPETVRSYWSKRSAQISDAGGDSASPQLRNVLAVETRDQKSELTRAELEARWAREGLEIGFGRTEAQACLHRASTPAPLAAEERRMLAEQALARVHTTQSVFTEPAFIAALGVVMQGRGTSEDIDLAACDMIRDGLVEMGLDGRDRRVFSTQAMIDLEAKMVDAAARPTSHRLDPLAVERAISERVGMTAEQASAVRHACLDGRRVTVVEGAAGAGKSFAMDTVKSAFEGQGYTLHGLALSWSAAAVLSESAKIANTRAVEGFVKDLASGKVRLGPKSVVLIDEAGLVGSRHMAAIVDAAEKAGSKVLLSGDTRQLSPVDAGGAMEAIVTQVGSARIDAIRRQGAHVAHDPEAFAEFEWARSAVADFAHGRADLALDALNERGRVHFADNEDEALDSIVALWDDARRRLRPPGVPDTARAARVQRLLGFRPAPARIAPDARADGLLLTLDNATAHLLNERVRALLRSEGELGQDAITIPTTDLRRAREASFAVGDRVMFRQNDARLGVSGEAVRGERAGVFNRTLATIIGISDDHGVPIIETRTHDGRTIHVRCDEDGYWDRKTSGVPLQHAYATTVYGSQGMTVPWSALYVGDHSRMDRRQAYVGMSRWTTEGHVFAARDMTHQLLMSRTSSDKWVPRRALSDQDLLDSMKVHWGKASEKTTTVQFTRNSTTKVDAKPAHSLRAANSMEAAMSTSNRPRKRTPAHTPEQIQERQKAAYRRLGDLAAKARTIDLPAYLQQRGIALKREGTKGFMEAEGAAGERAHFFQGNDGTWRVRRGDQYLDAIGYVQQLDGLDFKAAVFEITGNAALATPSRTTSTVAPRIAAAPITLRNPNIAERNAAIAYARDTRLISRDTLRIAHQQNFFAMDDRGVVFQGFDSEGRRRNAETRLLKPTQHGDNWLSKLSYPGSDKSFPPVLHGVRTTEIHLVEGGFDALALHDLRRRDGEPTPTVIVTGGARTMKWQDNPQIQNLLRAADTVVVHKENEVTKRGLVDPKKQAETDAAHDRQIEAIRSIRGRPDGVESQRPPHGVKDLADLNRLRVEHERRAAAERLEESHQRRTQAR